MKRTFRNYISSQLRKLIISVFSSPPAGQAATIPVYIPVGLMVRHSPVSQPIRADVFLKWAHVDELCIYFRYLSTDGLHWHGKEGDPQLLLLH